MKISEQHLALVLFVIACEENTEVDAEKKWLNIQVNIAVFIIHYLLTFYLE